MRKIYCIGSAVVDISAQGVPEPKDWMEKQRIEGIRLLPGGDAVNQAIILRKLLDGEEEVQLVSAAGQDANGAALRAMLKERNVGTAYVKTVPDAATGTSLVLVHPGGERRAFSVGGPYDGLTREDLPSLAVAEDPDRREERSGGGPASPDDTVSAISLASLFQLQALETEGLAEYLQEANTKGIPVFADLGSDKKKQGFRGIAHLLPHIDWFLPSEYDALQMAEPEYAEADAGLPDGFRGRVEKAARFFAGQGARGVVIKCGKYGCYFLTPEESGWVPALPVTPVDTTGAGDCMVAVFLSQVVQGSPVREACETACRLASWSTRFPGANSVNFGGIE